MRAPQFTNYDQLARATFPHSHYLYSITDVSLAHTLIHEFSHVEGIFGQDLTGKLALSAKTGLDSL